MALTQPKVFEFFNREVTQANAYQTKEVFGVSQELLSVLDGKKKNNKFAPHTVREKRKKEYSRSN